MKKLFIIIIFGIFLCPGFASEETTRIGDFDFAFSSQPNPDGNRTEGMLRYYYNDIISSSFAGIYETRKTDSELSIRKDSLIVSKTKDLYLDIFFIEYKMSLIEKDLTLSIGAALNLTNSTLKEKGFFITSPTNPFHPDVPETVTTNHVLNNDQAIWFYSPKIQANLKFIHDILKVDYVFEAIPIFKYDIDQTMSITPLVPAGEASYETSGSGTPYLKSNIRLLFVDLIEFQYIHEYQKFKFKQLGIGYNSGWILEEKEENEFTITSKTLLINLRPDLFMDIDLILGAGKRFLSTKNNTTSEDAIDESEWIYNLGFAKKMR